MNLTKAHHLLAGLADALESVLAEFGHYDSDTIEQGYHMLEVYMRALDADEDN